MQTILSIHLFKILGVGIGGNNMAEAYVCCCREFGRVSWRVLVVIGILWWREVCKPILHFLRNILCKFCIHLQDKCLEQTTQALSRHSRDHQFLLSYLLHLQKVDIPCHANHLPLARCLDCHLSQLNIRLSFFRWLYLSSRDNHLLRAKKRINAVSKGFLLALCHSSIRRNA